MRVPWAGLRSQEGAFCLLIPRGKGKSAVARFFACTFFSFCRGGAQSPKVEMREEIFTIGLLQRAVACPLRKGSAEIDTVTG